MKVLVAGGREVTVDFFTLDEALKSYKQGRNETNFVIVTGGARGIDTIGKKWAKARGYKSRLYPADWKKYGKRAGYLRNVEMADSGLDFAIIVWDGQSSGTEMMRDLLVDRQIPHVVIAR